LKTRRDATKQAIKPKKNADKKKGGEDERH
jgi:hypothetical protein